MIKYGTIEIPLEAFLPENIEHRVSFMCPMCTLQSLQREANDRGMSYQNLIVEILREYVNKETAK